jgi:hypothetical protein
MKAKWLVAVCMLCVQTGFSCDMCNYYLGLNPGYNNNSVGLRWKYRHAFLAGSGAPLKIQHLEHDAGEPMTSDLNVYHNDIELFGRIYPHPKVQLLLNIPFSYNVMTYGSQTESMNAPGDITGQAFYQVANTMPMDSLQTRHRLFVGGGIKFPTGKSSGASEIDIPMAHHLLPGTGSTDYLVAVNYIGKKSFFGWNVDANYKMNGSSSSGYRYGNAVNITGSVFYEWKKDDLTFFPHIGTSFEQGDKDDFNGETVSASGGTMLWASAGFDVYYGKFALGNDIRLPLSSNLSEGMPVDKEIFVLSLSYNF